MAFHEYGGNDSGDTLIALPQWVMEIGKDNPDIFFTDREGRRNPECLSWGIDKERVLKGRTAIEVFIELINLALFVIENEAITNLCNFILLNFYEDIVTCFALLMFIFFFFMLVNHKMVLHNMSLLCIGPVVLSCKSFMPFVAH